MKKYYFSCQTKKKSPFRIKSAPKLYTCMHPEKYKSLLPSFTGVGPTNMWSVNHVSLRPIFLYFLNTPYYPFVLSYSSTVSASSRSSPFWLWFASNLVPPAALASSWSIMSSPFGSRESRRDRCEAGLPVTRQEQYSSELQTKTLSVVSRYLFICFWFQGSTWNDAALKKRFGPAYPCLHSKRET